MKKLLTACIILVSALAIHASASDNTKALNDKMNINSHQYSDTIGKDTTKKDTMFSSAVAYRTVSDTMPSDTTKKDSAFLSMAFNK